LVPGKFTPVINQRVNVLYFNVRPTARKQINTCIRVNTDLGYLLENTPPPPLPGISVVMREKNLKSVK
jgi:hypothetical protein